MGADTGAALLQPPKSSSWVTVGCVDALVPVLLPHPPKSSEIDVVGGALYVDVGEDSVWVGVGAGLAGSGSGVLHASLEPHASILFKAPKPPEGTAGFG